MKPLAALAVSPPESNSTGAAKYETACRALAEAKSVDEVKDYRDKAEAMRCYARQAKNRQLETDAAEIRIRAERRIGELIAAQRDAGGLARGTAGLGNINVTGGSLTDPPVNSEQSDSICSQSITLAEAGIDKHLADRARKLAALPEKEFNGIVSEWRDRIEQENERVSVDLLGAAEKHVRGTLGTGENEWYTPQSYVDLARAVLGTIDLDPASSEIANKTVAAASFFTEADTGLEKEWRGNIWLNPPYAQPAISHFAEKAVAEWTSGRMKSAIILTHNYTDTAWFHTLAAEASAICFTRGRVKFFSPSGEVAAPTQGQAFFYFGPGAAKFIELFATVGFVIDGSNLPHGVRPDTAVAVSAAIPPAETGPAPARVG